MTVARHDPPAAVERAEILHEVLLASAGSGKTWRLAIRYLRLVAMGADPATILASTFTRAAAGEIRDRILERCAEAALDRAAAVALSRDLGVGPGSGGHGADAILRRLVAAWPRLQVRTLDSALFAIVSAHGVALGIDPATALADEAQVRSMRREATRRLLDRFGEERAVALLRELTAGRSDSNVAHAIDTVVDALHDLWREAPSAAWEAVVPGTGRGDDEIAAAVELVRRIPPAGNRNIDRGLLSFVELASAGRWEALIAKGVGRRLAEGAADYYGRPLPEAIVVAGALLVDHARAVVLEGIRRQTIAARDLVAGWSAVFDEVKRERRLIAFDDLPWLLARAEALGSIDEIAYRLDARLHHMLLDEMQDTSAPQWMALRPFAEELYRQRAGERSFFCVGDLKQSIYGWRGASPEILASLPATIGIEPTTLALTRRCGPTVVAAVNRVFGAIDGLACLEDVPGAARRFKGFFVPHETARAEPGYAEVRAAPAADGDGGDAPDPAALRLRAAAATVARLHRAASAATVGVLVRTNSVVNRMLYLLGPGGHGLPVAGRGGAPLTDAPPVEAVIDLLRLAIHPGHTVAAFNVARSPLGVAVGLRCPDGPARPPDEASRSRVAAEARRRVARDGLGPSVAGWVARLASSADARERRRLVQLAELAAHAPVGGAATAASFDPPDPIAAFIELVETRGIADEGDAPIQVMTVHQSKGMEFDLVVLPELEGALVRGQGQVAGWDRAEPGGPPSTIIRWVDEERRVALPPELAAVFDRHRDRLAMESLCLLYVALTRARDGLYAHVDPPRKGRSDKTAAGILRHTLGSGAAEVPGEPIFASGDERAMLRRLAGGGAVAAVQVADIRPAIELRPARRPSRVAAAAPSTAAHAATPAPDPVAALRADPARRRDAIDRGSALHAMLERCEWLETFDADDAALAGAALRAAPHRDAAWAAAQVAALRPLLVRGALADALRRGDRAERRTSGDPDAAAALREHRFARLTVDGLQVGSIDRLVIVRRAGRVVAAEIVDFKTGGGLPGDGVDAGEPSDDPVGAARAGRVDRELLAERHRPQVAAYRAAVAEQFRLPPDAIAATLVFVDLDLAIDVAPSITPTTHHRH